jgi:chromate transport protein ChrA
MNKILTKIKEDIYLILISTIIYVGILAVYMFFEHNDIISNILTSTLHLCFLLLFASLFNIKSNLLKYLLWIALIPFLIVILFLNIKNGTHNILLIFISIVLINLVLYFKRKQAKQKQ